MSAPDPISSKELFDRGYAIPLAGGMTQWWRWRKQEVETLPGAVRMTYIDGWPCAKWDDVMMAAQENA